MSAKTYEPGDIVVVTTTDVEFGKVRVPAVVRFKHDIVNVYEVNAFLDVGPRPGVNKPRWWTVSAAEIECSVGKAYVEATW
jgi:hypothetical protein